MFKKWIAIFDIPSTSIISQAKKCQITNERANREGIPFKGPKLYFEKDTTDCSLSTVFITPNNR